MLTIFCRSIDIINSFM